MPTPLSNPDPLPDLYTRYAAWWPLMSAPEDYQEEAEAYSDILCAASVRPPETVLELGSGGGNNASHMKARFRLTLADRSPAMLAVSRAINPQCEHIEGDMRTLRLGRLFDAVFVHDAVVYMRSREDLEAAMRTAFVHCRPGGAVLLVPDYVCETFRTSTSHGGHDGGDRAMRYLQWDHAPAPCGTTYRIDFAYLLRDTAGRTEHAFETHVCGLFSTGEWLESLSRTGFRPWCTTLESDEFESGSYRVFIGRKPD